MAAQKKEDKKKDFDFDYKNKAYFKLSDQFKHTFNTKVAGGGETINADGLIALAHIKGMWKLDVNITQYPCADNNNVCICKATVGGYDYDPITKEIIKVEYSDIGDASPANCSRNVAPHFIRMASTRAIGRALRKYTNLDMVCTEELNDDSIMTGSMIADMSMGGNGGFTTGASNVQPQNASIDQLNKLKELFKQKNITPEQAMEMLTKTFGTNDFTHLSAIQAEQFIQMLNDYVS